MQKEYTIKEKLEKKVNGVYNRITKRSLDLFFSLILLIFILPVYLVIITIQLIVSGKPIFYTPLRAGFNDKAFKIIKFRTMVRNADKIGGGTTALNDIRITKFGKFLRKTKLDEIPQLINIIIGNMSFIGPRPELLKYTDKYSELEQYILKVRPGITDYSSIKFINLDEIVGDTNADDVYEQKILTIKNNLRLEYVLKFSFFVDLRIFFVTLKKVAIKAIRGGYNGKN